MKILTFCNYPVYMCFYRALSDIGNHVIVFDISNIPKPDQYSYISKYIDDIKPDIVLTVGRPEVHGISLESLNIVHNMNGIPTIGIPKMEINGLSLEILKEICNRKGILHVYWATEDRTYNQKYSMEIAKYCDFIFTPAEECIQNYTSIGKYSALLRYGCYPEVHRKVNPHKDFISDIAIAASYHSGLKFSYIKDVIVNQQNDNEDILRKTSIEKIVYPLIEKGYNISIWGQGWEDIVPSKYIKGYVPYYDVNLVYSSSKIILGLEWDNISKTKTTGRPFEVLGCGGCFISFRTKALLNTFIDRSHLALTSSAEETLDIVDYYLNNNMARSKVAQEGQKEVYGKHTYYHRAGEFMNALKPHIKTKV